MKLAKCSFCGLSPRVFSDIEDMGHNEYYLTTYVLCTSCKSRGPVFCDFDYPDVLDRVRLASEGWNKIHDRKETCK